MSFTFTNNPSGSNRDLLRILLNDTSSGTAKFSDETLAWFYDNSVNIWYAAAEAADTLAALLVGGGVRRKVGDLEIDYGGLKGGSAAEWRATAARFRVRGQRGVTPFAGGIQEGDRDTEKSQPAAGRPSISVGMHDYTGSTGY